MSKRTENALTLVQLAIISIFVIAGLAFGTVSRSSENFQPFFPKGFEGILVAMGLLYVIFEGSELITTLGEEIRDPERNIPRAIFISLGSVVLIYILITVAAISTTPWETLAENRENAIIVASGASMGILGIYMIIIGGAISALSGFNSALIASSRVAFAMGRRGHLPPSLGVLHRVSRSPTKAVIFSGSIIILMVLLFPLATVAASASLLFLISFILVNISLIVLRNQEPTTRRGFKVPFYPLPPIIAIAANVILAGYIFTLDQIAWYIALLWIEIGLVIYYLSRGKKEAIDAVRTVAPEAVSETKSPSVTVIPLTSSISRFIYLGENIARQRDMRLHLLDVVSVSRLIAPGDVDPGIIKIHTRKLELMCRTCSHLETDYELIVGGDIVDAAVDALSAQRTEVVLVIIDRGVTSKHIWRWITSLAPYDDMERILIFGGPSKEVKTLCLVSEDAKLTPTLKNLISFSVTKERSEILILPVEPDGARKVSTELTIAGLNSTIPEIKPSHSSLVQIQRLISESDAVLFVVHPQFSHGEPKFDPKIEVLLRNTSPSSTPVFIYLPAKSKNPAHENSVHAH